MQYLALNRASGCLELKHGLELGRVFFEEGRPVHALCAGLGGSAAVSYMLAWPQAEFVFKSGAASPQRSIHSSLDTLLLEAAYQADTRVAKATLSDNSVLQPLPLPAEHKSVELSLGAIHLLRRLDGKRSLGVIARQLNVPLDEVLKAAQELLQQALAQVLPSPVVPAAFWLELTQLLVEFMGPIAEVVLDDTLFDLALDTAAVPEEAVRRILDELAKHLQQPAWRAAFEARARALCDQYGIAH